MTLRQIQVSGLEAMEMATRLLQRSRLANPVDGPWEAADIQWSWRTPRISDDLEKTFWLDSNDPVAGIWMTCWPWQIDPIIVPGTDESLRKTVWQRVMQFIADQPTGEFNIPVDDNNALYTEFARNYKLMVDARDSTGWLDAMNRPQTTPVPDCYTIVDRTQQPNTPHPMRSRNGDTTEERLNQCSFYDPSLDLVVISDKGQPAGYSLYWFDPVTKVGLVEPVRVEDEFQRKGLARAMLTTGIQKLVDKGAERIKVSWESEAAGALYLGVGFQLTSTTTWYQTHR